MSTGENEDTLRALEAFKKCANVEMCQSIGYKLGYAEDDFQRMNLELVDILNAAHRYKEAGDLTIQ